MLYKITFTKESRSAVRKALDLRKQFCSGDFWYIASMRSKKIDGTLIEYNSIREPLAAVLNDLKISLFGLSGVKDLAPAKACIALYKKLSKLEVILDEKECQLICASCEAFARLHCGQIEYAVETIPNAKWDNNELGAIEKFLKRELFGLTGAGHSLGVGNREATHLKDICFSAYEAVRYRLAWDRHPEGGMTVDFGTPMNWYPKVPLLKVERMPE